MFLLSCPKSIRYHSSRFQMPPAKSSYLRVVKFTWILGIFLIYIEKLILDIHNKSQITVKMVCTMRMLTKSIPQKKRFFFEIRKKLKFGRGCPESAGMILDGFRTPQKIMITSSILKKIWPTKRGVAISGQHGRYHKTLQKRTHSTDIMYFNRKISNLKKPNFDWTLLWYW